LYVHEGGVEEFRSPRLWVPVAQVEVDGVVARGSGCLRDPALDFKDLVDSLPEALEVVVHQCTRFPSTLTLLVEVLLPEYADQRQEPVHLLQVQHRAVVQLDDARGLAVEPTELVTSRRDIPINAGNVHDDVDHVAAQLVRLHVDRRVVRGNVHLGHHVKQECFVDARVLWR
ncbi:unnamed protein product, partial [Ixodes pacificus]